MATTGEVLNAALRFHQGGNLVEAERLYREILDADPRHADAWHLVGLVAYQSGDLVAALGHIARAIQLDPAQASYHNHLGEVYRAMRRWPQAEACCRRAVELKPNFAIAHNTLGAVLADQGQTQQAIASYREAVKHKPDFVQAHFNLGAALQSLGRLDDAVHPYREALRFDPRLAAAENNLGALFQAQSKWDEAAACYRRALAIEDDCADAHFNLGVVLQSQDQMAAAVECYQNAIRAKADYAPAYNNLGAVFRRQNRLAEAIECYQRALEFRPNFAEALNNLGNVFQLQGRNAEAMICYEQTLRIEPECAQSHYNLSRMLLAAGDFSAGWREHEWRLGCSDLERRTFVEPRWHGEPLEGRTLLVHSEQGLGDTIQFVRYLPLVARFGGKVIVEVPKPIFPLLRQSGVPGLVAKGTPLDKFDVQVPMMSLPLVCGTTLETIPADVPYLSADPQLVEHWRGVLGAEPGLRVGIAWQGSTTYWGARLRSMPLAQFAPLAQAGVELISLQKGPGTEQLADLAGQFRVRQLDRLDEEHGPFMDTAAIMKNLDLVITSDTAIPHLAGALGVRVWVALALSPDWRWLQDREDSPWYPTMRLFRQTNFDDWQSVFRRMAEVLRRKVAQGR